jgi:hypothetical protein
MSAVSFLTVRVALGNSKPNGRIVEVLKSPERLPCSSAAGWIGAIVATFGPESSSISVIKTTRNVENLP